MCAFNCRMQTRVVFSTLIRPHAQTLECLEVCEVYYLLLAMEDSLHCLNRTYPG